MLLSLLFFCLMPAPTQAFVPLRIFSDVDPYRRSPYLKWQTIETRHFRVHFSSLIEPTGRRAAQLLEEAYSLLSPFLEWEPRAPIDVSLLDNQDEANGLAAPVARFGILLWVSPPETYRNNNFYDAWLWTLILHELTHYIQIDTTHGLYNLLRALTGDLILPNVSWPRWMLEGFAVYMETYLTKGGRGRSSYYEMVLRTSWIEGTFEKLFSLDRLAGNQPLYPGGDLPYQMGFHLFQTLAAMEPKKLSRLSHEGASGVPILIDAQLRAVDGKSWMDIWQKFRDASKERAERAREALEKEPLSRLEFLTEPREDRSRVVRASTRCGPLIAYHATSTEARGGLWLYDPRTKRHQWLNDKWSGGSLQCVKEDTWILSSQLRRISPFNGPMHDLQWIHSVSGRRVWLSEQARARDPFLFDAERVVFTQYQGASQGGMSLAVGKIVEEKGQEPRLKDVRVLWSPGNGDRISNPSVKDGWVYFSWHQEGAFEELIARIKLDAPMNPEILVKNEGFNRFPVFDPSGRLCFVSNQTGIDNLYCSVKGVKKFRRYTHLYSGLEFPAFDAAGGLIASVYTSQGWQLARVEMKEASDRLLASPAEVASPGGLVSVRPPDAVEVKPYSPIQSMQPRFWLPSVNLDRKGILIGAQIEGWDTLDFFRYTLGAAWHSALGLSGGIFQFTSRRMGPTLGASIQQESSFLISKDEKQWLSDQGHPVEDTFTLTRSLGGKVTIPFNWTYAQLNIIPALNVVQVQFRHPSKKNALSDQTVGLASLGLLFSDTVFSDLGVAPEGGRQASLGVLTGISQETDASPFSSTVYAGVRQFFELFEHGSLQAYLRTSLTPQTSRHFRFLRSNLQGRSSLLGGLGSLGGNGQQGIGIRGFPNQVFFGRWIGLTGLELAFPIWNVYRGLAGSLPILAKRLSGATFVEGAMVDQVRGGRLLASAGGVIKLECELFSFPISMSGHVDYGFLPQERKGTWDVWFSIEASGLNF